MVVTYFGLGSNIGCRKRFLRKAKEKLQRVKDVNILKCSSFYFSEPIGGIPQPWFINGAIKAETALGAKELLRTCKEIENKLGRKKSKDLGPRIIDIDLLLFGNEVIKNADLKVPHPEIHLRKFVLLPLLELDKDLTHPEFDKSLKEYMDKLKEGGKVIKSVKKGF